MLFSSPSSDSATKAYGCRMQGNSKADYSPSNVLLSLSIPVSYVYFSSSGRFLPVSKEPVKSIPKFSSLLI